MALTSAPAHRSRLRTIVVTTAATVTALGTLAFGNIAANADIQDPGHRINNVETGGTVLWLGALDNANDPNWLQWCIEMGKPTPEAAATTITSLTEVKDLGQGEFTVTTPQMAWLLENKEGIKTADSRAALSFLLHANYDLAGRDMVAKMMAETQKQQPQVITLARTYLAEAKNSAAVGYEKLNVKGEGKREGLLHNIGTKNANGAWVPNVPLKVTLEGPAVFKETGTNTWSGKTKAEPISLEWKANGNGIVKATYLTKTARKTLTRYAADGTVQETLSYGGRPANGDPEWTEGGKAEFKIVYDFQPIATSNVGESKFIDATTASDTLTAKADPAYGNGEWFSIDGTPVPVTFEGKVYHTGEMPAPQGGVPAGATPVATTTLTFNGPGEQTANVTLPSDVDPGFLTWVWSVKKADQGQYADYIHADWSDAYGIAEETAIKPFIAQIDTAIAPRETKTGTYLVDDVWVSGFPENHGEFAGSHGFDADTKTMKQELFFFPEGLAVLESNKAKAELIAAVDIPAKNGYYPSVGSTKFKVKDDNEAGTYVFVTSFTGDSRVKAMTTSVEDKNEQFTVEGTVPTLKTTATDEADGDKELAVATSVTVSDKVCYTGLKPGKEYTLDGKLMDKSTGKPLMVSGKEVTSSKTFTPTTADGCEIINFTLNSSELNGKSTVVFENLTRNGKTVAVHADINDEGQTVKFVTPNPKLARTGATNAAGIIFGSLALAGLGAGAVIRRRAA